MSLQLEAPVGAPPVVKEFTGEYYFLSNFFHRPLMFAIPGMSDGPGLRFPSSEHAYQAGKAYCLITEYPIDKLNFIHDILNCVTAGDAKKFAHKVKIDVPKWESIKDGVMRAVVFEKFRQHTDLLDKLLATHTAMLVEGNTWGDTYWGRVDGKGLNRLGSILMETRGYFYWKQQQALDSTLQT